MSLEDVAHELYGLAPEEFTAARNARAKEARSAGDAGLARAVQGLRRPTTGAWLLNQLVRRHADEVAQVLQLGGRLREAQGTVGADELRALDRQRRSLTHAVAQQARAIGLSAGRRVTDQVTDEVEETLRSAMVDAAAGAALTTGLLTDTFSATGIDPVDLAGVVALGEPAADRVAAPAARRTASATSAEEPEVPDAPDPVRERELDDARSAVSEAEFALVAAREASERAHEEAADVRRRREQLEAEREEARRRLAVLDADAETVAAQAAAANRAEEDAARQEAAALEAADRLRERVEALIRGEGPRPARRT